MIPDQIEIDGEYWGSRYAGQPPFVGKVLCIFRDSLGDQYAAFEMPDQAGTQLIHLGSRFFVGFNPKGY